jgi:hypothetical protein
MAYQGESEIGQARDIKTVADELGIPTLLWREFSAL